MAVLEKRVSATKWVTPSGRAARSSRSSRRVPRPCRLVVVGHHEGHLGIGRAGQALEAPHPDDRRALDGDEGHPVSTIDVGEVLDLRRSQHWVHGEEPVADRLGRQAAVERDEAGAVVRPHRADAHVGLGTVHARQHPAPRLSRR